jgi:hypothetical protein
VDVQFSPALFAERTTLFPASLLKSELVMSIKEYLQTFKSIDVRLSLSQLYSVLITADLNSFKTVEQQYNSSKLAYLL